MAMHGETVASILGNTPGFMTCPDCGTEMPLKVLHTCAYYIGYFCDECGPFSRESLYYETELEAQTALDSMEFGR